MVDTKIVHVKIYDAVNTDVIEFRKLLTELKKRLNFKVEFVITNEKIELHDIKYLIKELYDLYAKYKQLYESETNTKGNNKSKQIRRETEFTKQEIEVD